MSSTTMPITKKLIDLQGQLNQGFIGKEEVVKSTLLSLLAGENTLLLGSTGTGKNSISCRIADAFAPQANNLPFFQYVLTSASTPEEVFGANPQSTNNETQASSLNDAQVVFLDNIFKANSALLSSLQSALRDSEQSTLRGVIGSSQQLPSLQDKRSSLYDYFLIRKFVNYLPSEKLHDLFDLPEQPVIADSNKISDLDLVKINQKAKSVTIPEQIKSAIKQIWQQHSELFADDKSETLSDRRFIKVIHLLKISAATNGRDAVDFSDLLLLKDVLWNDPSHAQQVQNLVLNTLHDFDQQVTDNTYDTVPSQTAPVVRDISYVVPSESEAVQPVSEADDEVENVSSEADDQDTSTSTANIKYLSGTPSVRTRTATNVEEITTKGTVVKGLRGSGTADDPILIESIQNFARLQEPAIGTKGYYFKQTTDLDFSPITENAWLSIDFTGHYDGNNHKLLRTSFSNLEVFRVINEGSVTRLQIANMVLASHIVSSEVRHCISTESLCDTANSSLFQSCYCHATLVYNLISDSKVTDCVVYLNNGTPTFSGYAISKTAENTLVANCFVHGDHSNYSNLIKECRNTEVKHCVVGNGLNDGLITVGAEASTFVDNKYIVTDNNDIPTSEEGENRCEPVSEILVVQSYYQYTLGWNFDTIWEWDEQDNQLQLQTANRIEQKVKNNTKSLLDKQMSDNIWI